MKQSIYHRLSSILWRAIVVSIVLLAVYVSLGRALGSLSGSFQQEILGALNQRVPFTIDANRVSAEWYSFNPVLVLEGLRVTIPGESGAPMELSEGRVALDVAGSLLAGSLQMNRLQLDGLDLAGEFGDDGRLRIRGFEGDDSQLGDWLKDFLLNVERVVLGDTHLDVLLPGGEERGFDLDLTLSREGSRRRLEGNLLSSRGARIFVLGEGVGNMFMPDSFKGELYLDIGSADVGAVSDLLPDSLRGVKLDGSIGLELWSSWDLGKSATSIRLRMNDVLVSEKNASWQVPLDRVAFEASLVDRKGGWGLSVAGLELTRGETRLQVPRLQLNIRGETVNLRALEVPLEPLASLLSGTDSLPPTAVELLQVLQPRGSLQSLQVNIADITAPQADWQLRANFDQLAVESWRGAPGVRGARGYVELARGAGSVVLDSQQFSMSFPTVYEVPLLYDDFHGTIHIDWDEEAVVLSSGLVTASSEEGTVPVLFGLTIPRRQTDVGLEMDLLVGLEATHPGHRGKYLPFFLNDGLHAWLSQSIGDGLIEQGGFLWRGSLTSKSPELRTVQLFFNIRDTALRYHADWPELANVDGTVLINDSDVSVWAGGATLLETSVSDLSIEVWLEQGAELWLAAEGKLAGPADDGLQVVNNSPLGRAVGGAFSDWQLTGVLETELDLLLNLSDSAVPPEVSVSARFDAVDVDVRPGKLPLRGISGVLDYESATGFSSRDLAGQLWGKPLQASVGQRPVEAGSDRSAVAVEFSTVVDMTDIQQWLELDLLDFAEGRAEVSALLLAGPVGGPGSGPGSGPAPDLAGDSAPAPEGESPDGARVAPTLTIDSTLEGVSLNLPEPWKKNPGSRRPLRLDIPLGGESLRLGIALGNELQSQLEVSDGRLRSASVGLERDPAPLEDGRLHVRGHAAYADTTEWQRFLTRYVVPAPAGAAAPSGREEEVIESGPQLAISVDDLWVDQMVAGDQDLGEVWFSLADEDGLWRLAVQTDWLRGELAYLAGGESLLDIGYLDLSRLDDMDLGLDGEGGVFEVPDLAVTIAELRRAETLLGEVAFHLHSDGADLHMTDIHGEIAALQVRSDEPGWLIWHQGDDSRTTVEARLRFRDLGKTLDRLGYQKTIETEEGFFNLALNWPGAPQEFSLLQGQGSLQVEMGEGHFPEAPGGAAGALRVINILNLAEIVQRLSLNDRFDSGIPFNDVQGEVFLHAGTIEVVDMNIQGSGSSFQFSGVSDVASRSLDGELVVTLPVAGNLPWVAALTAGLPVAAGVYLLSKVFETPLNRLTSAVYSASGTWDDPEVKFDRVFDDTVSAGAGVLEGASPVVVPQSPGPDQPESP